MGIGGRKTIRFLGGLVRMNVSRSGVSWTTKAGPWSWNSRARRHRVNLPGPFHWSSKRR